MAKKSSTDAMPSPSPSERDYETEGHLRTLMEAESIRADPGKMKKVMAHADKQKKAITSIQGIKDTYKAKYGSGAKKQPGQEEGDGSNAGT